MLNNEACLQVTLRNIQLRLSVRMGKRLTQTDLAEIAGVGSRSFGEWMRGTTSPAGMLALLKLLSLLPPDDLSAVLSEWSESEQSGD